MRREEEEEVSLKELQEETSKIPDSVNIEKTREYFGGKYQGTDLLVSIDSVTFGHSEGERYFIEAEVCVEKKEDTQEAEHVVKNFLRNLLATQDLVESPGMFSMAFEGR